MELDKCNTQKDKQSRQHIESSSAKDKLLQECDDELDKQGNLINEKTKENSALREKLDDLGKRIEELETELIEYRSIEELAANKGTSLKQFKKHLESPQLN